VVGWLPKEANAPDDALFHVAHHDGDEEDLDEQGVSPPPPFMNDYYE
jgi:hypothetical protein